MLPPVKPKPASPPPPAPPPPPDQWQPVAGEPPADDGRKRSPVLKGLLISSGTALVLAALVSGFLIFQSSSEDTPLTNAAGETCEPGTGIDGDHCYTNGLFPNISNEEMDGDIRRLIRDWYGYIAEGDLGSAWELLTPRKRRQIRENADGHFPKGYESWANGVRGLKGRIDPSGVSITKRQSYKDEGAMTIKVKGIRFNPPRGCSNHPQGFPGGITWVRYDEESERWLYEPGKSVTAQRKQDWRPGGTHLHFGERLLGHVCK